MTETIKLNVDQETARAFRAATAEEKQKLMTLIAVWLKQPGTTETAKHVYREEDQSQQ